MRMIPALIAALIATPIAAPTAAPVAAAAAPAPPRLGQAATPAVMPAWQPAAAYVTAGQDEPGYRSWYLGAAGRSAQVKTFNDYLEVGGVAGVVPTWQLLRTASSWERCGAQPFEVPPPSEWPHVVQTLRYVRDHVIPAVGPVEAVSAYRNPSLNVCAGGAPESAHKHYSAIDMVPLRPIAREALMTALCDSHTRHGAPYRAGLGFYAYVRFHVDSTKFRRWNMDPAVARHCPPIIQQADLASVGQPLEHPPLQAPSPASGDPLAPPVGETIKQ